MLVLVLMARAGAAPAGSVDRWADELAGKAAAALEDVEGARVDVAVSVRARQPETAGKLAGALQGLLVARLHDRATLRGRAVRSVGALDGADGAAARRAGYEYWLDVEIAVEGADVVALGRLVPTGAHLWAEAAGTAPRGAIASVSYGRARIDAEMRALLGPAPAPPAGPTETAKPTPSPSPSPSPSPQATAPKPRPRRSFTRPRRLELDLGAPLLALGAGDVDADGAAELVVLTTDEVVVLRAERATARHALPGPAPVPRPRDPVGALVVADLDGAPGAEILARSSAHAEGVRLAWRDGALVAVAPIGGDLYPLAVLPAVGPEDAPRVAGAPLARGASQFAGAGVALEPPGRAAPAPLPDRFLALDAAAPATIAVVDLAGTLRIYRGGQPAPWAQLSGVGTAVELVDFDDDGRPELVTSAHRAPGSGDVLTIRALADDGAAKILYRGDELRGGIVGVAAGDFDGDGTLDVAAAARLPGSHRADLWLID